MDKTRLRRLRRKEKCSSVRERDRKGIHVSVKAQNKNLESISRGKRERGRRDEIEERNRIRSRKDEGCQLMQLARLHKFCHRPLYEPSS